MAQVHSWGGACLPEVPARLQDDEVSFAFRNTFLGTLLLAKYAKGEATFKSESLTTLAIVKEVRAKRLELRARARIVLPPSRSVHNNEADNSPSVAHRCSRRRRRGGRSRSISR